MTSSLLELAIGCGCRLLPAQTNDIVDLDGIAEDANGSLLHFDRLGYVVVTTAVISLVLMYFVQRPIAAKSGKRVI